MSKFLCNRCWRRQTWKDFQLVNRMIKVSHFCKGVEKTTWTRKSYKVGNLREGYSRRCCQWFRQGKLRANWKAEERSGGDLRKFYNQMEQ